MTSSGGASFDMRGLPFKKRLILALAPFLAGGLLRLLYLLNRKTTRNPEVWDRQMASGESALVAVWHENFPALLPRFAEAEIDALTSQSFDGELAARLIGQFGVGAFRGSSTRGGVEALNAMVRGAHDLKALGLTIDGPRGPRRRAKPGIAVLSMRTQLAVIPIAATATRSFRPRSWDRTCVPYPFGRYVFAVGEPIAPPPENSDQDVVRQKAKEIEDALNALQQEIEAEYGVNAYFENT